MGKYQQECDYQSIILNQNSEIAGLKAQVNELREDFIEALALYSQAAGIILTYNSLSRTPEQSLAEHDKKVRKDALEGYGIFESSADVLRSLAKY